jgi:hypothetical protein
MKPIMIDKSVKSGYKFYESHGLRITQLPSKGSDFFPILRFKVEVQGEKSRIDTVNPNVDFQKFMYLMEQNISHAEAYYNIIV